MLLCSTHDMKLADLDPDFIRITKPDSYTRVAAIEQAQGVMFLCPTCFQKNGGDVGTHWILCWFVGRGVPDTESPGPGRWTTQGTNFENLTLNPSVLLPGEGCGAHFFVRDGMIL